MYMYIGYMYMHMLLHIIIGEKSTFPLDKFPQPEENKKYMYM